MKGHTNKENNYNKDKKIRACKGGLIAKAISNRQPLVKGFAKAETG